MGKLIIGDFMSKKYKNNYIYSIIIIILIVFSYYEIKSNVRVGGLFRDFFYTPLNKDNYKELYTLINEEIKKENNELKSLLEIDYSMTDYELINATIIDRSNILPNEFIINKGKDDGIDNNQIVINKNGMIGKVIDSSYKTSVIRLITSFDEPILVKINDITKLLFINNYNLYIRGINKEDNIKVGDKVVTSGSLPNGIVIGEIESLDKEYDTGFFAKVKISVNLNNIRFVTVLKRINI